MPSLTDHPSSSIVKMIVAADSGAGKSGSLASLVDAGLKVNVLDFDNGLSVLPGYIQDKSKLANVRYVELYDQMKLTAAKVGITKAHAFQWGMEALDKGTAQYWGEDIGPATSWGDDTVLVIDTVSTAGKASMNMVLQLNGKGFAQPELQHYGTAMDNIEKMIQLLTSEQIKCHVLLHTHLTNVEGTAKLYPEALGSKLGPKLGRYVDNMITLSTTGGGERTFKTSKDGLFTCKTAKPLKETYPIKTGLADIFKALTGKEKLA